MATLQTILKPPKQVWQPWFFSRLVIWVAMGLIAPSLPVANALVAERLGWDMFLLGDGQWYAAIATSGYLRDAAQAFPSVAFFPLYPLLCAILMQLCQIPFVFAGLLINNLAFLLALILLHRWIAERWNAAVAKWTIALLAWYPLSLFSTLANADGLFLLLNVLTLQCFSRQYYGLAAGFGVAVTATRSMGLSLMPTFVSTAWHQRRSRFAYWAAGLSLVGGVLYSLYCGIWFGDLFAFDRALDFLPQRSPSLLDWRAWGQTLLSGIVGPIDPETGRISSIWFPIQFCLIEIGFFLIWRFKEFIRPMVRPWLVIALMLWLWLLWPIGLIRTITVFGGLYLFWTQRSKFGVLLTNYTFWSLLWVAFSPSPFAPERDFFAIVALPIGCGFWFAQHRLWRIPILVGFGLMLVGTAILLVQQQWII